VEAEDWNIEETPLEEQEISEPAPELSVQEILEGPPEMAAPATTPRTNRLELVPNIVPGDGDEGLAEDVQSSLMDDGFARPDTGPPPAAAVDALLAPDPLEHPLGVNWDELNGIVASAGLHIPADQAEEFIQVAIEGGLSGPDDLRQYAANLRRIQDAQETEIQREARLAALEERHAALPGSGSPIDALRSELSEIKQVLFAREQEAQFEQQFRAETDQRIDAHANAWEALTSEARRRGLELPSPEAYAELYAGGALLSMDPTRAARLAWAALTAPEDVLGPRVDRKDPRRSVIRQVIPATGISGASGPRTIDDIL